MKPRHRKTIAPAIFLIAAVSVASAADFHEGLAAYNQGDYDKAIREWGPLAERGDPESQYRLARMYYHGEGKRDDAAAAKWYAQAAEQGHLKAQNNLGLLYEEGRGVERDDEIAARWYRSAAEQGLTTAQGNLARMYDAGRGVERDPTAAARWYRNAAEQGHAPSQYRLGQMYDEGAGVPRDPGKAAKWYRKAAKQGHGLAQRAIGVMYAEGRGVSRDVPKATKWLSRASAQGIAVDASGLAALPSEDDEEVAGTPPREGAVAPAEEPILTEATAGGPAPQTGTPIVAEPAPEPPIPAEPTPPEPVSTEPAGTPTAVPALPEPARGAPTGPPPAARPPAPPPARKPRLRDLPLVDLHELRRVSRLAEDGDPEAQYRLAWMYGTGEGAPQSLDDAARWYLAAARQGHGMAAYKVALLYLRGRGFPKKDYVQAYRWFAVSAELDVGDAAAWRDRIRPKMTREEIAESERILGERAPAEE